MLYYSITEEQDETTEEIFDWMRAYVGPEFERHAQTIWMDKDGTGRVTVNTYPFIYPKRLPGGVYTGKVTIRTGSAEKVVPVKLRVGDCMPVASLDRDEVWPKYAGSNEITAEVSVELEQPAPPGGCTIEFDTEFVPYSGGHSHHSSLRHKGDVKPKSFHIPEGETVYIPAGKNDPFKAIYTSSDVSGEEKIVVKVKETDEEIKLDMKVRVPHLMPLPTGGHIITMHTTPEPSKYHAVSQSNYCTIYTALSVVDAVEAYASELNLHPDVKLAVIDMSLPWGGLFDIYGNWSPKHDTHRKGTMADLSKHYRDSNGNTYNIAEYRNGKFVKDTAQVDQEKLNKHFRKVGCTRAAEPQIHYNCTR